MDLEIKCLHDVRSKIQKKLDECEDQFSPRAEALIECQRIVEDYIDFMEASLNSSVPIGDDNEANDIRR